MRSDDAIKLKKKKKIALRFYFRKLQIKFKNVKENLIIFIFHNLTDLLELMIRFLARLVNIKHTTSIANSLERE